MSVLNDLKNGNNSPGIGEIVFRSTDHIRFQNGQNVSGHNYNCNRSIKIQSNINNSGIGYTVTIYNEDGIHPLWGNNIQMAPKQMKIIKKGDNFVVLQGYGYDAMGTPFSNYGLTVKFQNDEIESCVLHMLDRDVDLEYFK